VLLRDCADNGRYTSHAIGVNNAKTKDVKHKEAPGSVPCDVRERVLSCGSTGANTGNQRNWYNGDGLRVRARTFVSSRRDDDFVWDVSAGLPVVLQDTLTPQSGSPTTTTYLYGLGLVLETVGSTSYFYLSDGLGSTTELTDTSASVQNSYQYDVWGSLRATSGSTANQFEFAGQQTDHNANRGLQYLRARYYDPSLGRFISRDLVPAGNRYAYASNNPISWADPLGACSVYVGTRPVQGFGGAISRLARHAYIITADPLTGEKRVIQGEARGGFTAAHVHGKLGVTNRPFNTGPSETDFVANGAALYYNDDGSCDSINDSFEATGSLINKAANDYRYLSLNSNSAASTLLEQAGVPSSRPSLLVWGWGAKVRLDPPTYLPWYVPRFIGPIIPLR
jgi:RHS repeat-associated protein